MSYQPLPQSAEYPPLPNHDHIGPPYPLQPADAHRQSVKSAVLRYVVYPIAAVIVLHFVILGAWPTSGYSNWYRGPPRETEYNALEESAAKLWEGINPDAGKPGTFFRDAYPLKSMLAFWELAERQVASSTVDVCHGLLGREFIDAYHRSQMAYCVPKGQGEDVQLASVRRPGTPHWNDSEQVPASGIWCSPVQRDQFSAWWPYPAAPCLSTYMRPVQDDLEKFRATGCGKTSDGLALDAEMDGERFLGADLAAVDEDIGDCKELIERTLLVVHRQDQWNPFHVAEDLVTTLVSVFIALRTAPQLADTRVQIVFGDDFTMDKNHFTPLWDRVGAWAPRRLSLEPWGENVCLTNTIHSVGAGASLLSAMGVGKSFTCASTITWAASHYYRHLFGLVPWSLGAGARRSYGGQIPINVLWLSRAKFDNYAQSHDDWSVWRNVRHINNEPQLVDRLRKGLADLCGDEGALGGHRCVFEDAQDVPETWARRTNVDADEADTRIPVRFATIDPAVHALETQVHYVGHATVLVSSHGGALGLSLFLSPGQGSVIELQVDSVRGNYHFEHMAYQMGHQYQMVPIDRDVDVDQVWGVVQKRVNVLAGA